MSGFWCQVPDDPAITKMNTTWNLDVMYKGYEDPKYTSDYNKVFQLLYLFLLYSRELYTLHEAKSNKSKRLVIEQNRSNKLALRHRKTRV